MTPLELAESLAKSDNRDDVVEAIAMVFRGLTDPDPSDPFKQPWPKTIDVARSAAQYLDIVRPGYDLLSDAITRAAEITDWQLNR